MKAALGVAHIGAGSIGVLRAQAIAQTEQLRLKVVADVREDAAEAVARKHGCDYTNSWQKAINRAVAPTGRDGLRALQMAHAIYRSSREGQEVAV